MAILTDQSGNNLVDQIGAPLTDELPVTAPDFNMLTMLLRLHAVLLLGIILGM